MSHNNDSGKFFKFKNLQLVRKPNTVRQTRQNTDINTHGTAEEQFAVITATARADALREIDNISSDDESVDYSPPEQLPLEPQVSVRDNGQQISDSDETNKSTSEIATDSSVDTSSIEVIQPNEALAIKLPRNPPQRAPPNSPESPRTNVAVSTPQDLFTEDEDTEDDDVPPTTTTVTPEVKGRKETLSPSPQVSQTVRSAIEVTVKDFDPSEQRIVDKCGEVDFQLSNHPDWQQPNPRLRQDICDLLPLLYQSGFNTEGFPNLEDYLYQTVGTLPCQSLLRLALDSIFEEFPEISAIQTKVYRMLKCHLSVINHPSITQFDDISLSNHDFDRVVGPDFHNVSGAESRPDLSLQTDFNDTYYSVFSQAQRQVYRVTERSLCKLRKDRANSCPDIVHQLHRETDRLPNSKWKNFNSTTPVYPDQYRYRNDQQTQTDIQDVLQVKDTGAQYSSPSDTNESSSSDFDSDIEGTENITVTRRPINRRSASSEDLYSNLTPPHKRFRTSTPEPYIRQPENEPLRCPLKEIINHRPALQIPPVVLTVAPGRRAANVQLGRQRVNAMAGRGRNQPQPLQGADPALVQILQMMQNRDANRDNSRKQFLMFPKECFTGQDKKLAKSDWAEFSKYLDYQNQQGTLPRDLAHLPEIKSMFKLTLQDIALGWFETESPTWLTEDQMKQSFLKRFNPWGDTRRQQQDAWNKLKFDMTKDDVDSFVVDMKTLASILGHNDEIIMEKFKDVFADPNIEAALIAMDDFALMQKKAKQLVHIYKPAHDNPMASATILVHTAENTAEKGKSSNLKVISISWPLSINRKHLTIMVQVIIIIMGDNAAEDAAITEVLVDVEIMAIRTVMTIKNEDLDAAKDNVIQIIVEGMATIIHTEDEEDNGTEMTQITVTEIIGTEIMMVKVILTGVDDGTIIVEVKDIVIVEEVDDGILVSNIMTPGTTRNPNCKTQITIDRLPWDINTDTQSHMVNTHTSPSNNSTRHNCQPPLSKPLIFVNCATVKVTMTINANLQVILWHAHKKPSIKADHTVTKTLITGNGHKVTVTTMTQMGNLFSSGGSRCR